MGYSIRFLLFVACVSLFCGFGCEQSPTSDGAEIRGLIGGVETNYEKWRGVVGIYSVNKGTVCTGTLIHPRLILTAGHCVFKNTGSIRFDFTKNPQNLRVYGGPDIRVWENVTPEFEYPRVQTAVAHPEWKGSVHSADLSMLLLKAPIENTPSYCVRLDEDVEEGADAWLVGYGRTDDSDNTSDGRHQEGAATILAIGERMGEGPYSVIKTASTETSSCSGDSGGPVMSTLNNDWALTAVASMSDCFFDNINVNLVNHTDWIEQTASDLVGAVRDEGGCFRDPIDEETEEPVECQEDDTDCGDPVAAGDGGLDSNPDFTPEDQSSSGGCSSVRPSLNTGSLVFGVLGILG